MKNYKNEKDVEKIYGPYIREDNGRSQLVLIYKDGSKGSISYPKFLMENKLGRKLEHWETVDHINDDPTDDRIENLQVLSRKNNILKYTEKFPPQYYEFVCPECKRITKKRMNQVKSNWKKGKTGPFCGRACAGTYNSRIQYLGV